MPSEGGSEPRHGSVEDTKHFRNFAALRGGDGAGLAVLVLGGSTFMGRELVQQLVGRSARVCVVNRGRSYWGTDDTSGGRAARVLADRRDTKSFAALLSEATDRLGSDWALVADFSAYNGADIRCALEGLRGRFATYAYISSDSVYEVSAWAGEEWLPRKGCAGDPVVAEDDSARPDSTAERRRLRKADSYGDGKLEAEEALAEGLRALAASPSSPCRARAVALRLPDVIGPYDDTLRLWAYWHWLQAGHEHPPQVHDARATKRPRRSVGGGGAASSAAEEDRVPLAFVFSHDVARFIVGLLDRPPPGEPASCDGVNLACERQPDLREMLGMLAAASGLETPPKLEVVTRPKTFLPSVDRPWNLSCQRMLEVYRFTPTPLDEVLRRCADWFNKACTDFPQEALRAAMKLPVAARKAAILRAGITATPSSSSSSSSSDSDGDHA
mmetsp:Transcript_108131/g.312459  ORF Transcript_108131/g.312459 Transcript_108131/m.312459 type:complete len:443 (+) Transcript_108131:90-1418(+)